MLSSRCEQNASFGIFTRSESHFLYYSFFAGLFVGCRKNDLNCYSIRESLGVRIEDSCLLVRCIFQKKIIEGLSRKARVGLKTYCQINI